MASFKVMIDDPKEQYSPGQTIIGRVNYSVKIPHFAEIRVMLVGEESTYQTVLSKRWTCNFLETKKMLIYEGDVNVGDQVFPFQVTLPRYIPSSYIGKFGHVKFFVRAYLDLVDRDSAEDAVVFKVFSPINLNDLVNLYNAPIARADELLMDKWWCLHEEISMEVQVEKESFVVGDQMNVKVIIRNSSILYVSTVKLKLLVVTQAKVATPRQEFLNVHSYLDMKEDFGVGSYKNKASVYQLKIPPYAEVPNFHKCSLFAQTAKLEVIAEIPKTTKPDLKVEIDLVLGHIPLDGSGGNCKEKARLPDPVIIRPLPYGIHKPLSITSPNTINPVIDNSQRNIIPPYPLSSSPKLFIPEVSSHETSLKKVPVPGNLYENPLFPQDVKKAPYHQESNCPYPTENLMAPKHYSPLSLANSRPYPVEHNCPYPTEQFKSPTPYPTTTNPPYPQDEEIIPMLPRAGHSSLENQQFPYHSRLNSPYAKESAHKRKEFALYKMPMPSLSFDTDRSPYPTSTNPLYPKEERKGFDSPKMPMPPKSFERTNLPANDPPYPKEERGLEFTQMPMPFSFKTSAGKDLSCLVIRDPPYPTADLEDSGLLKKMPMPCHSNRTSFESNPPYPIKPRESESSNDVSLSTFSTPPYPVETNVKAPYPTTIPTTDSIGFAVPTTETPEPSAPPISFPTPPISPPTVPISLPTSPIDLRTSPNRLPTPPTTDIEVRENSRTNVVTTATISIAPPTYEQVLDSTRQKKKHRKKEMELAS